MLPYLYKGPEATPSKLLLLISQQYPSTMPNPITQIRHGLIHKKDIKNSPQIAPSTMLLKIEKRNNNFKWSLRFFILHDGDWFRAILTRYKIISSRQFYATASFLSVSQWRSYYYCSSSSFAASYLPFFAKGDLTSNSTLPSSFLKGSVRNENWGDARSASQECSLIF